MLWPFQSLYLTSIFERLEGGKKQQLFDWLQHKHLVYTLKKTKLIYISHMCSVSLCPLWKDGAATGATYQFCSERQLHPDEVWSWQFGQKHAQEYPLEVIWQSSVSAPRVTPCTKYLILLLGWIPSSCPALLVSLDISSTHWETLQTLSHHPGEAGQRVQPEWPTGIISCY